MKASAANYVQHMLTISVNTMVTLFGVPLSEEARRRRKPTREEDA